MVLAASVAASLLDFVFKAQAAQELTAARPDVDRQPGLDVGRSWLAELEDVVQRHQVEVVVRMHV